MTLLVIHLRFLLASWRSAHPLLWAALLATVALLRSDIFEMDMVAGQWGHWGATAGVLSILGALGYLTTALSDRLQEDSLTRYLGTRPVGRTMMIIRSAGIPVVAATACFLIAFPTIEWREKSRWWSTRLHSDDPWMKRIGMTADEYHRIFWTGAHAADRFRAAGFKTMHLGFESRLRDPARHEFRRQEHRTWARQSSNRFALRNRLANEYQDDLEYRDYLNWRDAHGPMTPALSRRSWWYSWLVIMPVNPAWIVWTACWLAFTAGVGMRLVIVYSRPAPLVAGFRNLAGPRALVPITFVLVVLNERLLQVSVRREMEGPALPRPLFEWLLIHPWWSLAAVLALLVAGAVLVLRDWHRRDIA